MESLTGFIPAGGEGQRLRPLTETHAKPILPVGSAESTLLDQGLDGLSTVADSIVVTTFYRPDDIETVLERRTEDIWVARDRNLLNVGGSMLQHFDLLSEPLAGGADLLVMPSDQAHRNLDLTGFTESHRNSGAEVSVLAVADKTYGDPVSDVTNRGVDASTKLTGIYLFSSTFLAKRLLAELKQGWEREPYDLRNDVLKKDPPPGINVFVPECAYWDDAGTLERYLAANLVLSEGACVISDQARVDDDAELTACVVIGAAEVPGGIHHQSIFSVDSSGRSYMIRLDETLEEAEF